MNKRKSRRFYKPKPLLLSLTLGNVLFLLFFLFLSRCGPGMTSRTVNTPTSSITSSPGPVDPGTLTISNLFDRRSVETGFMIGTSQGVSQVGVQCDGGSTQTATGTSTWSFSLPSGTSTWKQGSQHTLTVGSVVANQFYPLKTITVLKGRNKDINGDGYPDLVISAQTYNNGVANDGGVYIYSGSSSGIGSSTAGTPTLVGSPAIGAGFGSSLALGDINGDGYADLAIGAYLYNNGAAQDGGVYIYSGSSSGIASSTAGAPTIKGKASSGEAFGASVALGDIDGDGYADLIVGSDRYNNGSASDGGVYIYPGSSGGIASSTAGIPTIGGQPSSAERFGFSVALGDIDADGYEDLAIGAYVYNNGLSTDGGVYIYPGSSSGIASSTAAAPTIKGTASGQASFGQALAIGDMNGDGYADLAVGAPVHRNVALYSGGVYLYPGSSSGIASSTAGIPTIRGAASSGIRVGYSVGLGDLDGDGYADLATGAQAYNNGNAADGGVFIYSGSSSGIPSATATTPTIKGKASSAGYFGTAVALGDFNGDGYSDLIVGAWQYNNGSSGDGGVYFYPGSSSSIGSSTAGVPTILGKASSAGSFGNKLSF